MMHFLGGIFVGLMSLWFFFESGYIRVDKSIQNIVIIAGGAFVFIGVGWEVFEVLAGIPIEENYVSDTITDLGMGFLGTSTAVFIFIKLFLSKEKDHGE